LIANLLRTLLKASKDRPNLLEMFALYYKTIGCMEASKTFNTYKGRYTLLDRASSTCFQRGSPLSALVSARLARSQSGPMESRHLSNRDFALKRQTTEEQKPSMEWTHERCCKQELLDYAADKP
jgi:hypothetical protein